MVPTLAFIESYRPDRRGSGPLRPVLVARTQKVAPKCCIAAYTTMEHPCG